MGTYNRPGVKAEGEEGTWVVRLWTDAQRPCCAQHDLFSFSSPSLPHFFATILSRPKLRYAPLHSRLPLRAWR